MSVENWEEGQGLSWSGKWHYLRSSIEQGRRESPTLCGIDAYTYTTWPRYVRRLKDIAEGRRQAPICKRCERSQEISQPAMPAPAEMP